MGADGKITSVNNLPNLGGRSARTINGTRCARGERPTRGGLLREKVSRYIIAQPDLAVEMYRVPYANQQTSDRSNRRIRLRISHIAFRL
jgi:hypothetical protein